MSPISKPIMFSDFVWLLNPKSGHTLGGLNMRPKVFLFIVDWKTEKRVIWSYHSGAMKIIYNFDLYLFSQGHPMATHTSYGRPLVFCWFNLRGVKRGSSLSSNFGILLRRFFEKWLIKNLWRRSLLSKCSTLSFQFAWNIHRDRISCD